MNSKTTQGKKRRGIIGVAMKNISVQIKKREEETRSIEHKTRQGQLSHNWISVASPANLYKTINFGLF